MRDILSILHGSNSSKDGRPVLTARQAVGKDEGLKYFKPDEFIAYAKSLRPKEIAHLEVILDAMKQGLKVEGDTSSHRDKGGRTYKYPEFRKSNALLSAKLIMEAGMVQFLNDYMDSKFIVGFTLEELVEEALNA